jgi:hypothetical protein
MSQNDVRNFSEEWATIIYWRLLGYKNKEIAQRMGLAESWIENQMREIYRSDDYRKIADHKKWEALKKDAEPVIMGYVGKDPSKLKDFPLPDLEEETMKEASPQLSTEPHTKPATATPPSTEARTEEEPVRNSSRRSIFPFLLVGVAILLLVVLAVWAFGGTNVRAKDDVVENDKASLKLKDYKPNLRYDRPAGEHVVAPISFVFDLKNKSGESLVVELHKDDFTITDNTGKEADCWFWHPLAATDEWKDTLQNDETAEISALCGVNEIPPDVTEYVLTVRMTALPESKWIYEVNR